MSTLVMELGWGQDDLVIEELTRDYATAEAKGCSVPCNWTVIPAQVTEAAAAV